MTLSRGRLLSLAKTTRHSASGRDRPGEKHFDVGGLVASAATAAFCSQLCRELYKARTTAPAFGGEFWRTRHTQLPLPSVGNFGVDNEL